ncbi:MAG: hypothetical protein RLZ37_1165 [Actinomycetota bacterium]|jgi:hypothetical protein
MQIVAAAVSARSVSVERLLCKVTKPIDPRARSTYHRDRFTERLNPPHHHERNHNVQQLP